MKPLFNWKPSLLTSFSLLGACLTIILAVVLGWSLARQLEENALQQEAESAADQVVLLLSPNLSPQDLSAALDDARYAEIDDLIRRNVLHEHIVRVKIWNKEGLLIYSDEKSLAGQFFPITDDLHAALTGETGMEISNLTDEENIAERQLYPRLLEVYVPIRLAGSDEIAGVYEVYRDLSGLDPAITNTQRVIWLNVGLGFLALYGSLFTLVRNASQELNRQNRENKRLYELEQTRRAELAALYDLSRGLADAQDFDTTLALVTHHTVQNVRVTFSRVALLDGDEFVIRAAYPIRLLERDLQVGERYLLGANQFCQHVLQQNTPVVVSADSPDLSNEERTVLFLGIAKTVCLVPLRVEERSLGLLMFGEARSQEREPFSPEKLRLARSFGDQAASALYRVELYVQLQKSYLETALALANAVDAKDTYTGDHAERLADMALAIGGEMDMEQHDLESLRYGAILHDIGKIGVPDAVLQKPSRLTADEWEQMRQHPAIGARILAPVPRLAGAAQIVRHHHERYDGQGYPDRLAGEAIPLGARILTVVDSYSAITDKRVYKEARSPAEAAAELRKHAGAQFDPRVVEVFFRMFPAGQG